MSLNDVFLGNVTPYQCPENEVSSAAITISVHRCLEQSRQLASRAHICSQNYETLKTQQPSNIIGSQSGVINIFLFPLNLSFLCDFDS